MDALRNADAPVEANQIGATAEENVLAVVDDFVDAWMKVRAGPAAQVTAAFDKLDAQPGFGERARSAHASHAAADHDRRFWDCHLYRVGLHCLHDSDRSVRSIPIIADETAGAVLRGGPV
jgi:hypothetical protein